MTVFDGIIENTQALLADRTPARHIYDSTNCAAIGDKNRLILGRDAAFELGAGGHASVSFMAVTQSEELVFEDEVLVYGPELSDIRFDCGYARITLLRTDGIEQNGEQEAYGIIKNIDIQKYEFVAKGFMLRASALSNREQARVSKAALRDGLSFERIGNLFISKYKENPHVLAAKQLFITAPDAPYAELDALASRAADITRALNHIMADLKMDCRACGWKPVCDEVPGMRELHENAVGQRAPEK